jgi:hypothetical protein
MNSEERNSSMRISVRLALLACAGIVALAVANAAWAAYTPRLIVGGTSHALNARNSVVIGVSQSQNDDPTAKITINVPAGYQENLTQAPGTQIGIVQGTVILRGAGNATVAIQGTVKTDDPARYLDPAVNQCDKPVPLRHTAVWLLDVTIAGNPFRIPIYVDDVTNVPGISARIALCLAGPVGTPSGTQMLDAVFAVGGVFTNPSTAAVYRWNALFTPYVPGTANPNPLGTVESRAIVPVPIRVVIRARKRGKFVTITGTITIPGDLVPSSVQIWAGATTRKLKRSGSAKVTGAGRFSHRRRIPKRGRFYFYQSRIDLPAVDLTASSCTPPSPAPAGCVTATMTPVDVRSNTVRVRLRRR